ncbi:hypothetical protein GCM10007877_24960 [Marinibactrum halimedae]|uniref:Uncharacterized protein n=1 Tax=Marinibactrum halimedae TaxID=1444977 RepID=A0AA37T8F0_9GAMM|nr:hypothetical protein GCM10007877_24960 [Marinibactrum halimedae]
MVESLDTEVIGTHSIRFLSFQVNPISVGRTDIPYDLSIEEKLDVWCLNND